MKRRPRRSRLLVAAALAAVAGDGLPAQDAAAAAAGWSIVRQDLEVTIDAEARGMAVAGVLELRFDGPEGARGPTLGLNSRSPLMKWRSLSCEGAEVEIGEPHATRPHRRLARVRFDEPRAAGEHVSLAFECALEKSGRQLVVTEGIALASWVEAWYPVPEPAAGVSLGQATRAAGKTTFDLPLGWSAVTNGALVSREDRGDRTVEVWSTSRALSRSFAAAPFRRFVHEVDARTASLYLLSDRAVEPEEHVRALSRAITAMEARWGRYPFENFSIAEVPGAIGAFGASSEQGFILVKPYFLAVEGGNLPLFAHEAAHAWWGNTVGTEGPGSLLCSESLAQYGAVVAIEALEGEAAATEFLRFSRRGYVLEQCARGYFGVMRRGNDVPLATLVSGGHVDHLLSDAKGHWVYHMLRRRIGDEVFFATLRRLIRDYDGRTMSLDALRAAFVAAAPDAGLTVFFRQWLDRTGAPVLQASAVGEADRTLLHVRQVQDGDPFVLDLDVELRTSDGRQERRRVRVGAEKRETFVLDVPADGENVEVVIDPDHELLIWCPEYGPAPNAGDAVDPAIAAAERAVYLGTYDVEGRDLVVRVVERGERLGIVVGSAARQDLVRIDGHAFLTENGRIVFDVTDGAARGLALLRHDGRTVTAVRR